MPRRFIPSLTSLRAFEAFARIGSMTGAAGELCVTHGAVSRQIRVLEAQVGVALVVGPRHQLALTDAGRQLAAGLGAAFDMIARSLPGAGETEELVVSCYGTLAMKWLIPRLPRFLERYPSYRVRIVEDHRPVDFSQGGIHAAIRSIASKPLHPARVTPFMESYVAMVMTPGLLDETGGDMARILALPRLHSETFPSAWDDWASHLEISLPPASLNREFEHNSYMLEAAAAGLGVAIAPWAFASADVERGRLVAPMGFHPVNLRFVYLRPRLGENPAAAAFGDWLVEEGRNSPPPPIAGAGKS